MGSFWTLPRRCGKAYGLSGYAAGVSGYHKARAARPNPHSGWTVMFGVMFLRTPLWWTRPYGVIRPDSTPPATATKGNHYIMNAAPGKRRRAASYARH